MKIARRAELGPAEIVGEDEDDIRWLPGCGPGGRKQGAAEGEDSCESGPASSDLQW